MSKFLKIVAFALIAIVAMVSFMGCEAALSGADGANGDNGQAGEDGHSKTDIWTLGGVQDWNNIATSDIVGKTKFQAPFFGEERTDNTAYSTLAIEPLAADGSNALHMTPVGTADQGFFFTNLFSNVPVGTYKITTSLKVNAAGAANDTVALQYAPVSGFGIDGIAAASTDITIATDVVTAYADFDTFLEVSSGQGAIKIVIWGKPADIVIEKITMKLVSGVTLASGAEVDAGYTVTYDASTVVGNVGSFVSWNPGAVTATASATGLNITTDTGWGPWSLTPKVVVPSGTYTIDVVTTAATTVGHTLTVLGTDIVLTAGAGTQSATGIVLTTQGLPVLVGNAGSGPNVAGTTEISSIVITRTAP